MELTEQNCKACEGGIQPLTEAEAKKYLPKIEGWVLSSDHKKITQTFEFKNYWRVMAFVNAVAYMTHRENHHPDMQVFYNKVIIDYTTHAIHGLSENDIICAAKVNKIFKEGIL